MVRRVFHFVYREVRGLHQAAYILALFAFGSQLLAIVRDRLLAHTFGAGRELDLYYTAFRIPDLLFVLFSSVLSIYVLLPFVNKAIEQKGTDAGKQLLSQVFTVFLVGYSILAVMLSIGAPFILPKLFPGFETELPTLVLLTQILLLQPLLLGVSTLCGVVTQMGHRFVLYALSPLLYNAGIIFGIVALYPFLGLQGLVYGVLFGAIGHVAVQIPFVRTSELSFSLVKTIDWRALGQIVAVSLPRAITLSINQVVLLVLIGMATAMTAGSVSVFQFAFNLQSVPLAIIGMSYSVAAFPTLSRLFAKQDHVGFNRQLLTALRHIIFWSMPIIALVVVLRAQIVRVLLGSGAFNWNDTRLTAAVLAMLVISLAAQAALLLLIRAFYASGKTRIPLMTAMLSAAVTLGLAWYLTMSFATSSSLQICIASVFRLDAVPGVEVVVLAAAFTVGQLLQLALMLGLTAKQYDIGYRTLAPLLGQSIVAALAGAVAAYLTLAVVVDGINQETFLGILLQGMIAGVIGLGAVVATYAVFDSQELFEIRRSFRARLLKTDVTAPQEEVM